MELVLATQNKDIEDLVGPIAQSSSDDSIRMYLREIGQIPLLTSNRELELSRAVQEGIVAQKRKDEIESGITQATSVGVGRLFLAALTDAYEEETLPDGSTREVLHLVPRLAPKKVAVLPLVNKLNDKAIEVFNMLSKEFATKY